MTYKPDGYNDLAPYLCVDGADKLIAFLVQAFGGESLRSYQGDDGRVMHAEVRLGDSIMMLADSSENWPATTASLHLYVSDLDGSYQRALAAGASEVQPPSGQAGDSDRRGTVRDPFGNIWTLSVEAGS